MLIYRRIVLLIRNELSEDEFSLIRENNVSKCYGITEILLINYRFKKASILLYEWYKNKTTKLKMYKHTNY